MLRVAYAVYNQAQMRSVFGAGMLTLLTIADQSGAFAASRLNSAIDAGRHPVLIGQQNAAQKLRLRGVIERVDLQSRRIALDHLAFLEAFWAQAIPDMNVDESVNLPLFRAGSPVVAVVERRPDGHYHIVALQPAEPGHLVIYAPGGGQKGSASSKAIAA